MTPFEAFTIKYFDVSKETAPANVAEAKGIAPVPSSRLAVKSGKLETAIVSSAWPRRIDNEPLGLLNVVDSNVPLSDRSLDRPLPAEPSSSRFA